MKEQLWNLFRETGEPMGYLLYRADCGTETDDTAAHTVTAAQEEPHCQPASVR